MKFPILWCQIRSARKLHYYSATEIIIVFYNLCHRGLWFYFSLKINPLINDSFLMRDHLTGKHKPVLAESYLHSNKCRQKTFIWKDISCVCNTIKRSCLCPPQWLSKLIYKFVFLASNSLTLHHRFTHTFFLLITLTYMLKPSLSDNQVEETALFVLPVSSESPAKPRVRWSSRYFATTHTIIMIILCFLNEESL